MDMYVRLYEDKWQGEGDNPTLGIILCTQKGPNDRAVLHPEGEPALFAATYQLYLPTEEGAFRANGVDVQGTVVTAGGGSVN